MSQNVFLYLLMQDWPWKGLVKILKEAGSEAMTSIVHQIYFSVSQLCYISPTLVLFSFGFRQRACHLRTMMHFA